MRQRTQIDLDKNDIGELIRGVPLTVSVSDVVEVAIRYSEGESENKHKRKYVKRKHSPTEVLICRSPGCGREHATEQGRSAHESKAHGKVLGPKYFEKKRKSVKIGKGKYKCLFCPQILKGPSEIAAHNRLKHRARLQNLKRAS